MESLKEEIINGYKVTVEIDEFADNPRNWDNLGKWVCAHKRYTLPNEIKFDFNTFNSWEEVEAALSKRFDYVIPLYMYDHSSLSFNLGGLSPYWQHGRWDGGQVGCVVANKSDIRRLFQVKKITKSIEARALDVLRGEVEDYDQYSNGNVYMVQITDPVDDELIDTCGGFYDVDEAFESGKGVAESLGDRQALIAAKVQQPELVSY